MLNLHTTPTCNICYLDYSEKKNSLPYIFQGCGHTMCQTCITKTKQNNKPICAFCKKKAKS